MQRTLTEKCASVLAWEPAKEYGNSVIYETRRTLLQSLRSREDSEMAAMVHILVGTKKGVFILDGDAGRRSWSLRGPFCETWPINHVVADPRNGTLYAAGGNEWFGPAIWKSTDLGASWTHSSKGIAYDDGEEPVASGWSVAVADGAIYAGVQPAGLFRSDDGGETWTHVKGLRDHPTRPEWSPGGAGLILHSLLVDPADPRRIWVGISAAGVFYRCLLYTSPSPRDS